MPEVDQGIGERFEGVMHLTEALEAKRQAAVRCDWHDSQLAGGSPAIALREGKI